jgi:peptidoglycan/xylan/chitin deacetylase (PgdA/CDA1 family)
MLFVDCQQITSTFAVEYQGRFMAMGKPVAVREVVAQAFEYAMVICGVQSVCIGVCLCTLLASGGVQADDEEDRKYRGKEVYGLAQKDQSPIPVVALTFDNRKTTPAAAFEIMRARGLVGTFFVNPDTVNNTGVTSSQLQKMAAAGWSIQGYSGGNMVNLLENYGERAARDRLQQVKKAMTALGFPITAIAPAQRSWNTKLSNLAAEEGFKMVRVVNTQQF